jgi:hypothetical protein
MSEQLTNNPIIVGKYLSPILLFFTESLRKFIILYLISFRNCGVLTLHQNL